MKDPLALIYEAKVVHAPEKYSLEVYEPEIPERTLKNIYRQYKCFIWLRTGYEDDGDPHWLIAGVNKQEVEIIKNVLDSIGINNFSVRPYRETDAMDGDEYEDYCKRQETQKEFGPEIGQTIHDL